MTAVNPDVDYYQVLGLDPGATTEQITWAYRHLARRYHPDLTSRPGAAEQFARITGAYRVLSDPVARARYDATRATAPQSARPASPRARHRPGRAGTWAGAWPRAAAGGEAFWLGGPSFSHAFSLRTEPNGAPNGGPARTEQPTAPQDTAPDAEVEVSVEEAYLGTDRIVTITGPRGVDTVPVTIPPGVVTGARITVPVSPLPGGRGDRPVQLRVRIAEHRRYRVDGREVHLDLPLTPWEAALGGTISLQVPTGAVDLDVPAGTSTGHVLRVPGQGLPNPTGAPGDLCAHVRIVLPPHLSPGERHLFARLAATCTFNPRTARPA